MRTRDVLNTAPVLFPEFPDWEVFFWPEDDENRNLWVLRWAGVAVCLRTRNYNDPTTWTVALRTACCGVGFTSEFETDRAVCLHCGNRTVYGAEVQLRLKDGDPYSCHPRAWFEPYTDPLRAELLADEMRQLSLRAESLLKRT